MFFNDIKNVMNIENVINIIFANKYYINELFPKLSNDEDYTSKYFNYNYELPSDHLSYIQNNFINQFDDNLDIINYKNDNLQIFNSENSISNLFKDKLSFRYIIKNSNLINNFIKNIIKIQNLLTKLTKNELVVKNSENNELIKMFEKYYKNFEWLFFPLFLILKGHSKITLESLNKFINENNIFAYIELPKINNFIEKLWILLDNLSKNKWLRFGEHESETIKYIYDEFAKTKENKFIFVIEIYSHIIKRFFMEPNSNHTLYKVDEFVKNEILNKFLNLENLNYFLNLSIEKNNNEN